MLGGGKAMGGQRRKRVLLGAYALYCGLFKPCQNQFFLSVPFALLDGPMRGKCFVQWLI